MSIRQLSKRNRIAWKTASDNAERLESRGLIKCKWNKGKGERRGKRSCELTKEAKRDLGL